MSRAAPWAAAGGALAAVVMAGLIPGYAPVVTFVDAAGSGTDYPGPSEFLLGTARWPYLLALTLTALALGAAAGLHERRPAWAAPAALLAGTGPAFAFVTELADPPTFYAPYAEAAAAATAEATRRARADNLVYAYDAVDVEPRAGAWLTFLLIGALALAATIWLGRRLDLLTRWRVSGGLLLAVVAAGSLALAVADPAQNCNTALVDSADVSADWSFWLVAYVPAVPMGAGLGALTRRRFAGGALLILAGAATFCALVAVFVKVSGPCLL